jgi:hypothetical protein
VQFGLDTYLDNEQVCHNTWHRIYNGNLTTDIAILGNSRAEAHYNPEIIKEVTGHSTYNLGLSGTPINILRIRWQAYFNNNALPKLLIVDVDNNLLGSANYLFEKFQYMPYTREQEYEMVAKEIDKDYYYEKYIPMYKYRRYEMQVFNKIKESLNKKDCVNGFSGYIPHDKPWNNSDWLVYKNRMDEQKTNPKLCLECIYEKGQVHLKELISFCKSNKIEICFVRSPKYYKAQHYDMQRTVFVDSIFNNVAKQEDILYFDFTNDSLCFSKNSFYDKSHLNLGGSNIFSKKIAKLINDKFFVNKE